MAAIEVDGRTHHVKGDTEAVVSALSQASAGDGLARFEAVHTPGAVVWVNVKAMSDLVIRP